MHSAEIYNYESFRREMVQKDLHFPGAPKPDQPAPGAEVFCENS